MPKIPLYNQGQGPTTRLATGQLSPRANVGAFTAPGQALAGFGQAASNVAFQFGMAEKRAETERVYSEELSKASDDFDEFKRNQPARTVEGFNITAGEFKNNRMAAIDARTDLTNNQKSTIKQNLGKNLDIKISSARNAVFNQHQLNRKNDFTNSINALQADAADPAMRDQTLADIEYLINFAVDNGFDTGQRLDAIKYDLDKKDHLAERENPNLNIGYFQNELSMVRKGEGKYSDYTSKMQRETETLIQSHIKYMETGIRAQAAQDAETAENNIRLTGDAGEEGQAAINALMSIGDETAAEDLAMNIRVGEDVYASTRTLVFASQDEINDFLDLQEGITDELVRDGKSTEAVARLEKINTFLTNREKAITEDPIKYVTSMYEEVYDREPTRSQIVQAQKDLGFNDDEIVVLTQSELTDVIGRIQNADTTEEVQTAVLSVTGDDSLSPYVFRQLRGAGFKLGANYVANQPNSPSSQLLLEALRPGAITIDVSTSKRSLVSAAVRSDVEVQAHAKSMMGGAYFDFNNNQIMGSVSSTNSLASAREDHISMLTDLTIYLIQKDNKTLSGDTGYTVSETEIAEYAAKAATVLSDRYDYIENFPNTSVSLRIPASMAGRRTQIKAGLDSFVDNLVPEFIFYDDDTYEKGTPEYNMAKDKYIERVKLEYGWVTDNDNGIAYLVDGFGGLVFSEDGEPIQQSIVQAMRDGEKSRPVDAGVDMGNLGPEDPTDVLRFEEGAAELRGFR